ncbi:PIN domain-like protein [Hysterangium stoloniferum]|nr:PIN domain-like protein [Hysterangium stoloniferum]
MGISGLLPLLKSVQKPIHLSELSGKTIAVDAYVWLHRGAYTCAPEVVTGKATTKYVQYALNRVRLLQYYNIRPYIVFDGGPLPAKKGTEVERKRKRDHNLELATTLSKQGKHTQAREHYAKCVDITPQMAYQFIKALRAEQIPYIVAPYEADAQLFYLEYTGIVDGVLTEDSDLLIFGTRLLLLKLDSATATCTLISADTIASNSPADLPLHGWGVKELRECAMLSGCDYIEGVRGVGLKTASKYLRRWGTVEKALRALKMDGKIVENDWQARMRMAELGFLHQRVWDPSKEEIVYLSEPDALTWDEEREKFVGGYVFITFLYQHLSE